MKNNVPNYSYPEEAVSSSNAMYHYRVWLSRPDKTYPNTVGSKEKAAQFLQRSKEENRERLYESEVHDVLNAYGFNQPKGLFARTPEEAVAAAKGIGYPVVMKIVSPQIVHKSDIGGVRVNLQARRMWKTPFLILLPVSGISCLRRIFTGS